MSPFYLQEVTVLIESILVAQMIIGQPKLKPTAKDLLSEGAKIAAVGAIAVVSSRIKRSK
ncbi:MAG: hypothetical protein ACAF41_12025 [Leptolyngbya sp. BL-A-14]